MNKNFCLAGLLIAGAATSMVLVQAAPASAACIGGNSTCSTFDPASSSAPNLAAGALSGLSTSPGDPYGFAVFRVSVTNFTGSSFSLDDFSLNAGAGVSSALTGFGPISITGNGSFNGGFVALSSTVGAVDFANSAFNFTIPSGVGAGTTLSVRLSYADTASLSALQIGTSAGAFTTAATSPPSAATPGPLPIIGAFSAFAASRQLRKRVSLSA